jgi:hypothetical protein
MPSKKAKEYYLGKHGQRFNCAEALIKAFEDKFKIDPRLFSAYGAGNAPGGVCGAYYAARHLLEQHQPDRVKEFDEFFLAQAGALECDRIRHGRKLSCLGCIEKSADFVAGSDDQHRVAE